MAQVGFLESLECMKCILSAFPCAILHFTSSATGWRNFSGGDKKKIGVGVVQLFIACANDLFSALSRCLFTSILLRKSHNKQFIASIRKPALF